MEYERGSGDDIYTTTENQGKIKEEIESNDLNLYIKNNVYTIYENFKLKNEEIDLKFDCHDSFDAEQRTNGFENEDVSKEISHGDFNNMDSATEEKKQKVNSLEINDLEEVKKLTSHLVENEKINKCIFGAKELIIKLNFNDHYLLKMQKSSSKMLNSNYKTATKNLVMQQKLGRDKCKIFKCFHCTYETSCRKYLIKHLQRHNNNKTFKCTYCSKIMINQVSLNNHLFRIHKCREFAKKIYECDQCTYEAPFKSHLLEHKLIHGITHSFQIVKCNQCTYKTVRRSYLKKHMETHKNLKNFIKCSYCSKEFKYKISLDNHLLTIHRCKSNVTGKIHSCDQCDYETLAKRELLAHKLKHGITDDSKILKCQQCSYQTYLKQNLNLHMKVHTNVKDFKCTYCSEEFKNKIGLDHHLLKNHNRKDITSKIHACDKCSYESLNKSVLLRHKLQHGIRGNFPILKCFQCDYETFRKSSLIEHMKIHQNVKDFKCTYCSKEFVRQKTLNNHLLKIHNCRDIAGKIYVCDKCSYKSLVRTEILAHKLTHGTVNSFQILKCPQCSYETFRKSNLIVHIKMHQNNKDFKCTYCSKMFVRKITLNNHLLRIHKCKDITGKIYVCDKCSYKSLKRTELLIHKLKHGITDGFQILKCNQCSYQSYRKTGLNQHISRIHQNVKDV